MPGVRPIDGDLAGAEQHFGHILQLASADRQPWYVYWAKLGLGDIKRQRGDLGAALADYQGAGAIVERLARADPSNTEWQRDLSVFYNRIGGVQVARGSLSEALKFHLDSLVIQTPDPL